MTAPRPTATTEVLRAPAKLTWTLRIVGVRDDGMHLIDAEMVTLDLADTLVVSPGAGLDVLGATGLVVEDGAQNLVARALRLVGREARVELTKRIPAGAGLGGGSADAAAILRWAQFSDLEGAATLGADVAFCLVGGRARVRGIGEVVEPLPFEDRSVTLLTPPFGCSTPAVYRAWDDMGGPTADGQNDLEPAALRVEPRLAEWRDRLGDATGCTPSLAGSGSTWFVEGSFPGQGRVVTRTDRP
jgi:4-diphosphocytidyl-2-C-methyl-D-erythritol kinase